MKYKVVLIDDDPVVLADQAQKWSEEDRVAVIGQFTGIAEAERFFRNRGMVDIIACDIDMPGVNGLEGADLLRRRCRLLVFLTGYAQYTLEAFEKRIDMYVMKPLTGRNILEILAKLENRHGYSTLADGFAEALLVTGFGTEELVQVEIRDITKIGTNGHYVDVYAPERVGTAHMSMAQVNTFLEPTDLFIRATRSLIVSLSFIKKYEKGYLYTTDGMKHRVGDVYGPGVRAFLKRHKLGRGMRAIW